MDLFRPFSAGRVQPTVAGIAEELARSGTDLGPWSLEVVRALNPEQRRVCAALLDQRRGLLREELCVAGALRDAEEELDRQVRREWLSCVHGELQDPVARRQCERTQRDVERLERDLVFARAALSGITEDVAALLRELRPIRPGVHRASA